jgi:2,3-bisphosphoglycerate-independent phosphoglycerate mutase
MIACGKKFTEHTTNKVPFIVVNGGDMELSEGKLANIAPTILDLLGVKAPKEFEENSLIKK